MSLYRIASFYIESDRMPESYDCFKVEDKVVPRERLLKITYCPMPHSMDDAEYLLNLTNLLSLWEQKSLDSWIFKDSCTGMTILVSKDYLNAEIYLPFFFDSPNWMILISTAMQILVECWSVRNGGLILHAACIQIGENGFSFSGPSGIGKSTRAIKMLQMFNGSWISGDKPLIMFDDENNIIAYGVPWDGKEKIYKNVKVQLKTIFAVERSENTIIKSMTYKEQLDLLTKQVFIPIWDPVLCGQVFSSIKRLMSVIPIYKLACDRTEESINVVHTLMKEELNLL